MKKNFAFPLLRLLPVGNFDLSESENQVSFSQIPLNDFVRKKDSLSTMTYISV